MHMFLQTKQAQDYARQARARPNHRFEIKRRRKRQERRHERTTCHMHARRRCFTEERFKKRFPGGQTVRHRRPEEGVRYVHERKVCKKPCRVPVCAQPKMILAQNWQMQKGCEMSIPASSNGNCRPAGGTGTFYGRVVQR